MIFEDSSFDIEVAFGANGTLINVLFTDCKEPGLVVQTGYLDEKERAILADHLHHIIDTLNL